MLIRTNHLIYMDHYNFINNQIVLNTNHYQILNMNVFLSIIENNKHQITYLLIYDIDQFFKFNFLPNLYIITILMNVQNNLTNTYSMHLQLINLRQQHLVLIK